MRTIFILIVNQIINTSENSCYSNFKTKCIICYSICKIKGNYSFGLISQKLIKS